MKSLISAPWAVMALAKAASTRPARSRVPRMVAAVADASPLKEIA
jgi:hypothetical protein